MKRKIAMVAILTVILAACGWSQTGSSSSSQNAFKATSLQSSAGNAYHAHTLIFGTPTSCSPAQGFQMGDANVTTPRFGITNSTIDTSASGCTPPNGSNAAFPSLVRAHAYGESCGTTPDCTGDVGFGDSVTVGSMKNNANAVTVAQAASTSGAASTDKWDNIFDFWLAPNVQSGCSKNTGCLEVELWLNANNVSPEGGASPVESNVTIGNVNWNIYDNGSYMTFALASPSPSLSTFDIGTLMNKIEQYHPSTASLPVTDSYLLNNVSYGFELWKGGNNLGMTSDLAVCVVFKGC